MTYRGEKRRRSEKEWCAEMRSCACGGLHGEVPSTPAICRQLVSIILIILLLYLIK